MPSSALSPCNGSPDTPVPPKALMSLFAAQANGPVSPAAKAPTARRPKPTQYPTSARPKPSCRIARGGGIA